MNAWPPLQAMVDTYVPRVLIFHPALAPYRIDLFNALSRSCCLRLISLLDRLPGQDLNQAALRRALTIDHTVLRRSGSVLGPEILLSYGHEIWQFKPDVVITSEFGLATLAVTAQSVFSSQEFAHIIWTDDNPESVRSDSAIRRFVRALTLPRIAGLITLSDEAGDLYRHRYEFRKPIGCVPILRNEKVFREHLLLATNDAISVVRENRLSGRRVLLYVGRLAPEKGLDALIAIFASIATQIPDAILVLVGDGPERQKLQELASKLEIEKRIVFAGQAEGSMLSAWYRIGSVLVLPSLLERFGAVVNEALLAGMPVICSMYAGARVLIREPYNGQVIDVKNNIQLRMAVLRFLENAEPVAERTVSYLRPSRMLITFEESVRCFETLIQSLTLHDSTH